MSSRRWVSLAMACAACAPKVAESPDVAATADSAGQNAADTVTAADVGDSSAVQDSSTADALDADTTADLLDVADTAPADTADLPDLPPDQLAPDQFSAKDDFDLVDEWPTCLPEQCAKQVFASPCLVGQCQFGQCVAKPVTAATACDDGNPCTANDTCCLAGDKFCTAGTCKSGANQCECSGADPAECEAKKGDGNKCNGLLQCDTSKMPFKCALVPQSAVTCPPPANPCQSVTCQPATGLCAVKAIKESEPCASDDPCTTNACAAGQCAPETKLCECASNADCAAKEDGDWCNGTLYCDKSVPGKNVCKVNPATVVVCPTDSDTACRKNVCQPASGACLPTAAELVDCSSGACKLMPPGQPPKANLPCEDGAKCTVGDTCQNGQCKSGTQTCACKADSDCAAQEDGDPCNGTLYCDKAVGQCKLNPATVVTCPPAGNFCQQNKCGPDSQGKAVCTLQAANEGLPCNDGVLCTAGDHCEKGACKPTANVCTCSKNADCAKAEDGDLCNGTLICDLSLPSPKCVVNPATVVICAQPSGACVQATCDKATGACKTGPKPDGTACDSDGNACTVFDSCAAGACKAGTNVCACQSNGDCAKFDDGNLCNGSPYCDVKSGLCKANPATVVACAASGNPCAATTCQPLTGQCQTAPLANGTPCDADGTLCTAGDVCLQGQCVAGANQCGCLADADCAPQEDGNLCNGTLHCDKTNGPPHCAVNPATVVACPDDLKPCTDAVCDPKTGKCQSANLAENTPCEDGKACTLGDTCGGGQCKPGLDACNCATDADCTDDGNACNGVPKCIASQCVMGDPVKCSKNMGLGCLANLCDPKTGVCAMAAGSCDDNNPCTADSCDKIGICAHAAYGDGTACGSGQFCAKGQCAAVDPSQVVVSGSGAIGCNSLSDPQCKTDELPQHAVTISPLAIDRFEVTAGAYAACVKAGVCSAAGQGKSGDGYCNFGDPFRVFDPINCVTAKQAADYCTWKGLRLPTEAEWELAARGSCQSANCAAVAARYVWGDLPLPDCSMTQMFGGTGAGCDLGTTLGFGAKAKDLSIFGVFDLAGNVQEWTADGYDAGFYATATASKPDAKNPVGKTQSVRGGGGASKAIDVRISARFSVDPAATSPWLGFRCAKTL